MNVCMYAADTHQFVSTIAFNLSLEQAKVFVDNFRLLGFYVILCG